MKIKVDIKNIICYIFKNFIYFLKFIKQLFFLNKKSILEYFKKYLYNNLFFLLKIFLFKIIILSNNSKNNFLKKIISFF